MPDRRSQPGHRPSDRGVTAPFVQPIVEASTDPKEAKDVKMMQRLRPTRAGRPTARSRRAWGGALVGLAALVLAAAGCGGSSKDAGSDPSASGGGSSDSTKLVQYAQCMREHGVPSFPDPVNGQLRLTVTKGGPLDPSSPQFQAAQQACKSLEPPNLGGGQTQSNAQQSQMLQFVSCMRQHGVSNFPDPQNGRFVITGGVDPNSPQFQSAMQACRKLLPAGATAGTP
jgi:hypothetical protein